MSEKIILLDTDKKQSKEFSKLLQSYLYDSIVLNSFSELETHVQHHDCKAVFIDIDTVPANNRQIRELTLKYPRLYFFCISKKTFHPELKDAICYHIYACINKPIDPDELLYFLKSVGAEKQNV